MNDQKKCIILASGDGDEKIASSQSSIDVASILNSKILYLYKNTWENELNFYSTPLFFLAMHGGFGEDGRLQRYLEERKLAHSHSTSQSCKIMSNKHLSKLLYLSLNIPTPAWLHDDKSYGLAKNIQSSWIKKPINGGSKVGIQFTQILSPEKKYILEEYIDGKKEISVWTIGKSPPFVLPPLLRSRQINHLGSLADSCDDIPEEVSSNCTNWAIAIHNKLNARGVIKTDFVINHRSECFAIETDAIPALAEPCGGARQAKKAGLSYRDYIHRIRDDYDT